MVNSRKVQKEAPLPANTFILVCALTVLVNLSTESVASTQIPKSSANNFALVRLSDKSSYQLQPNVSGRLVQLWASWCHSCGSILWDISELLENNKKVEFLAVSIDKDPEKALNYISRHALYNKLESNFYHDAEAKFSSYFNIETVPTILILDPSNSIIFRHQGHLNSFDLNKMNQQLKKLQRKEE